MNYEMMERVFILSKIPETDGSSKRYRENEYVNLANILSGVIVSPLINSLEHEEMNPLDLYNHVKDLYEGEDYKAAAYFIVLILEAAELAIPTGFTSLLEDDEMIKFFIQEMLLDFEDILLE